MESHQTIIEARTLTRTYGSGETAVHALRQVSFQVKEGEFLSIMGPSGSGKSTLLHLLGCLDQPTDGSLLIDSEEIRGKSDGSLSQLRGRKIGFVFQSFNLIPQINVQANVELPMLYGRIPDKERQASTAKAIELVGLKPRAHHRPTELSGGQAQRVAIARALVNRPRLLLADEPTGNLDTETGQAIMAIFQALNRAGLTIVMVTHDDEIAHHTSRILRVRDGLIEKDEKVHEPNVLDIEEALASRIYSFWNDEVNS